MVEHLEQKMEAEFAFSKVELIDGNQVYIFIEFDAHPVGVKEDFQVGKFTLVLSDLTHSPVFTADCKWLYHLMKSEITRLFQLRD